MAPRGQRARIAAAAPPFVHNVQHHARERVAAAAEGDAGHADVLATASGERARGKARGGGEEGQRHTLRAHLLPRRRGGTIRWGEGEERESAARREGARQSNARWAKRRTAERSGCALRFSSESVAQKGTPRVTRRGSVSTTRRRGQGRAAAADGWAVGAPCVPRPGEGGLQAGTASSVVT